MVFTTDGDGDLKDGYDTMAWLVSQTWCNGKIGTTGGSARGMCGAKSMTGRRKQRLSACTCSRVDRFLKPARLIRMG